MNKKITYTVPIYTFQIDFIGHVNNAVYMQWMEIGRTKLLDAVGMSIDNIAGDGIATVLVRTEIDYIVPLYLGDTATVELWLSELRRASARIEFRFYNQGGDLAASGSQRGLFINQSTQRPHRLSRERRALFEPYLIEKG